MAKKVTWVTNKVTLKPGTESTYYVTIRNKKGKSKMDYVWDSKKKKQILEHYAVRWSYTTVKSASKKDPWISGGESTVTAQTDVEIQNGFEFEKPSEATRIRVGIKPVAKTREDAYGSSIKTNKKKKVYEGDWSYKYSDILSAGTKPGDPSGGPNVELIRTQVKKDGSYTIVKSINISVTGISQSAEAPIDYILLQAAKDDKKLSSTKVLIGATMVAVNKSTASATLQIKESVLGQNGVQGIYFRYKNVRTTGVKNGSTYPKTSTPKGFFESSNRKNNCLISDQWSEYSSELFDSPLIPDWIEAPHVDADNNVKCKIKVHILKNGQVPIGLQFQWGYSVANLETEGSVEGNHDQTVDSSLEITRTISLGAVEYKTFYFRVRAVNDAAPEGSKYSDWCYYTDSTTNTSAKYAKAITFGKRPNAPSVFSDSSSYKIITRTSETDGPIFNVTHNSTDESAATRFAIEYAIVLKTTPNPTLKWVYMYDGTDSSHRIPSHMKVNDGTPTHIYPFVNTNLSNPDKKNDPLKWTPWHWVYSNIVDYFKKDPYLTAAELERLENGFDIYWRARTAGNLKINKTGFDYSKVDFKETDVDETEGYVYSPYSETRKISIYPEPHISIDIEGVEMIEDHYVITKYPITLLFDMTIGSSDIQSPININLEFISEDEYDVVLPDGTTGRINAGEKVYTRSLDVYELEGYSDSTYSGKLVLTPNDNTGLKDGIHYAIHAKCYYTTGLLAETVLTEVSIELSVIDIYDIDYVYSIDQEEWTLSLWPYLSPYHNADDDDYYGVLNTEDLSFDPGEHPSTIEIAYALNHDDYYSNPDNIHVDSYLYVTNVIEGMDPEEVLEYREYYKYEVRDISGSLTWIYTQNFNPTNATVNIFRINYDGELVQIGYDVVPNTSIVDPHPNFGTTRYRFVCKDLISGAYSLMETDDINIPCKSIYLQWDEKIFRKDLTQDVMDTLDEDTILDADSYTTSSIYLPYNIDTSEETNVAVEMVEYIGRSNPVSYYGTQKGTTGSWSVLIDKNDEDTIDILRRLQVWSGNVYCREPNGVGYLASVKVSFSITHLETTIPVSISLTRVEDPVADGVKFIDMIPINAEMTNCALSNADTQIQKHFAYRSDIIRESGAESSQLSVLVMMNGTDITSTAYDSEDESIYINSVIGPVDITAACIAQRKFRVLTVVINATLSYQPDSVFEHQSFESYVIPKEHVGLANADVTITIDNNNVTSTAYNETTGRIYISDVTGQIGISVYLQA